MKAILFATLLLCGTTTNAQVYKCPAVYPNKNRPAAPLTDAMMRQTDPTPTNHVKDEEAAEEGYDTHYALDPFDQTWLVCFYGGNKRIKGRFHDGHEWNQRMESADFDWEMRLAPKVRDCTVQVREIKARAPSKSTWTATAICKQAEP
jgi:hypothetical protein